MPPFGWRKRSSRRTVSSCRSGATGRPPTGRRSAPRRGRSGIRCWVGTSPTSAAATSRRSAWCCSPSATATSERRGTPRPTPRRSCWFSRSQVTPMHFHWAKMEDIINRGGGDLVIQLYNSTPDEELDKTVGRQGFHRRDRAYGRARRTGSPDPGRKHHADARACTTNFGPRRATAWWARSRW